MKLRALGDHVFVKQHDAKESFGSIMLPDDARMEQRIGTITHAGPGSWHGETFHPMELKVGDKVIFGQYSGFRLAFIEEIPKESGMVDIVKSELRKMRADEVLAVVDDEGYMITVEEVHE